MALVMGIAFLKNSKFQATLDSIVDYFPDITVWMLLFSVFLMFVMTAVTITGKTYKAATTNPVKALQTE